MDQQQMELKGPLWPIAYHEAGHAVAALELGVGIGRRGVSIEPGEDFAGFVEVLNLSGRPDTEQTGAMRLKAENRAIVSLAGPIAQRHFRPSSVRHYQGSHDRQGAIDLMSYFVSSKEELESYLKWLQVRAEAFVTSEHHWNSIDAVARELFTRKRLSRHEVETICREASSPLFSSS